MRNAAALSTWTLCLALIGSIGAVGCSDDDRTVHQVTGTDGGVGDGFGSIPTFDQGVGADAGDRDASPQPNLDLGNPPELDEGVVVDPDQGVDPDPDQGPPPEDADLPPDPNVNAGWIGGPCVDDGDCSYEEGYCLREDEGYPRGHCSQDCAQYCPDLEGMPMTFCVPGISEGTGACVQRCDDQAFVDGCRPGYHCENEVRYNEADVQRSVCLPGPPDEPVIDPNPDCFDEMDLHELNYTPTGGGGESPAGHPELLCTIDGPVRLSSPINGVSYRYVSSETATPLYVSCPLANALYHTSALLRERWDIVEVGHIGTYNCRVIAGTSDISMHGHALAIDFSWFRDRDGVVYSVIDDWEHNTVNFQTEKGRVLYEIARALYDNRIFNIVLTPNFNDAHDNHFHVDLTPGAHYIGRADEWQGHFGPNPHGD